MKKKKFEQNLISHCFLFSISLRSNKLHGLHVADVDIVSKHVDVDELPGVLPPAVAVLGEEISTQHWPDGSDKCHVRVKASPFLELGANIRKLSQHSIIFLCLVLACP